MLGAFAFHGYEGKRCGLCGQCSIAIGVGVGWAAYLDARLIAASLALTICRWVRSNKSSSALTRFVNSRTRSCKISSLVLIFFFRFDFVPIALANDSPILQACQSATKTPKQSATSGKLPTASRYAVRPCSDRGS